MLRYVAVQRVLADLRVHAAVPRPIFRGFQLAAALRAGRPLLTGYGFTVQCLDYFVNVETAHALASNRRGSCRAPLAPLVESAVAGLDARAGAPIVAQRPRTRSAPCADGLTVAVRIAPRVAAALQSVQDAPE